MKKPPAKQKQQVKNSELLTLSGINSRVLEVLQCNGYNSLTDITISNSQEIVSKTGLAEAKVKKIIIEARNKTSPGFTSGSQWLEQENKTERISTGSTSFDDLIGGGVEIGAITEVFGEHATGKTQLSYNLALNLFLQNSSYVTLVLDTELRFRIQRIVEMANAKGMTQPQIKKLLESVKKVNVMNTDDILDRIEQIKDVINSGQKVKLVIVDSLMAHFRAEYPGRATLSQRQQKLAAILHLLNKYAKTYNFAVYFTNHVMTRPDQLFGDATTHLGGHVVGHFSEYRIYLRTGKKGTRVAKLIDSPVNEVGEAVFRIENKGIDDVSNY